MDKNINENNNDNNLDIDTLIDEVLVNDNISTEEFEKNRIKTKQEVAKDELFSVAPKVDLEQIDKNLNIKRDKKKVEEVDKTIPLPDLTKAKQESIDFDTASKAVYNLDESQNQKNYKKVLSKLVKDTVIKTEPFKVVEGNESGFVEDDKFRKENLAENKEKIDDKDKIMDSNGYVTMPKVTMTSVDSDNTVSVRNYTPKTAIDDTYNYLYVNKATFATLATVALLCLVETGIMYFVINSVNPIHRVFYYIAALIALIPLGVGIFIYSFNPNKRVKRKFPYVTMFLNSFIVTVFLAVILLIIVLLSSISLTDPTDYVPKIILPCLYILNYPIGVAFFLLYSKTKVFFVEKK